VIATGSGIAASRLSCLRKPELTVTKREQSEPPPLSARCTPRTRRELADTSHTAAHFSALRSAPGSCCLADGACLVTRVRSRFPLPERHRDKRRRLAQPSVARCIPRKRRMPTPLAFVPSAPRVHTRALPSNHARATPTALAATWTRVVQCDSHASTGPRPREKLPLALSGPHCAHC